jgi:hypothetical protein
MSNASQTVFQTHIAVQFRPSASHICAHYKSCTFQHFHCEVLQYFIPLKYTKSCKEKYARPLHEGESVAAYINNIQDTTIVLQSTASGCDIITNNGSMFTVCLPRTPQNFPNLDHLASVDQVLRVQITCI